MHTKHPRTTSGIPDALKHFDELPNSAFVRLPTVAMLFGCSKVTVWRRSKAGTLPAPNKLSGTTCWQVGSLRQVLTSAK